jgi:hydrogenase maturation protein HypF
VARLRERKQREEKPFAVMVANAASAQAWVARCGPATGLLASPRAAHRAASRSANGCDAALPGVAPGLHWLGVMLPCTPIQYLLFHEAAGRPPGTGWLRRCRRTCCW